MFSILVRYVKELKSDSLLPVQDQYAVRNAPNGDMIANIAVDRLSELGRKLCAASHGLVSSLTEESVRFALAKQCAIEQAHRTSKYVKSFHLKDQDQLFEVAKLCAEKDGCNAMLHLENFSIEDRERRFQFAKLCCIGSVKEIALKMQVLDLDEDQRFRLAKRCAKYFPVALSRYIEMFALDSEEKRGCVAELCAQGNGASTAENIRNFSLSSDRRFAVAKLCVQQDVEGVLYSLDEFDLQGESQIFEIAQLCAQQNGEYTAEQIEIFGLTNQVYLTKIALCCAAQAGKAVARNIDRLGIEDRNQRLNIAKVCLRSDWESIKYLPNFALDLDESSRRKINTYVMEFHPLFCRSDRELMGLFPLTQPLDLDQARDIVKKLCAEKNFLQFFQEYIDREIQPDRARIDYLQWLGVASVVFSRQLDEEQLAWCQQEGLLSAIADLSTPSLRHKLTFTLTHIASTAAGQKSYLRLPSMRVEDKYTWGKLLSLQMASLIQAGVSAELIKQFVLHLDSKRFDRHGKTFLFDLSKFKEIVTVLYSLDRTPLLNGKEKGAVIKHIIDASSSNESSLKDLLMQFSALQAIIDFGSADLLKLANQSEFSLIALSDAQLRRRLHVENVQDVYAKYQKTFGASRAPNAILTYVSKMHLLNHEKIMTRLREYILSVLEGVHQEMRYSTQNNPHLAKLNQLDPSFIEKWRQNEEIPLSAIFPEKVFKGVTGHKVVITEDPIDLLLCGTEVSGSTCLKVDGSVEYAKCLISYLIDGKNVLIAVKNRSGRIVARAILRLLLDEQEKHPVVFLENPYPAFLAQEHQEHYAAILHMAKKKAEQMGLPLASVEFIDEDLPSSITLRALGGPAPFEYCDAIQSVCKNGSFSIPNAYLVS